MKDLPVLVDEDVWPEFFDAIGSIGALWTAPSGRVYRLLLRGRRLEVALVATEFGPPPSGEEIDADLLELACAVHDAAGAEWSGDQVRRVLQLWSR